MENYFERTQLLIGDSAMEMLNNATICVVGLGGVGSACVEALARVPIGSLIIVDYDVVGASNINRQLIATRYTIGQKKTEATKDRILSINKNCKVIVIDEFYSANSNILSLNPLYVVDAIDTVTAKLALAEHCKARGIPLIASLGTGNRFCPDEFMIGDIEDTKGCRCGLARVMRHELRKRCIDKYTVLYSTEMPKNIIIETDNSRHPPASISFCPPVAGYMIASYVVRSLLKDWRVI